MDYGRLSELLARRPTTMLEKQIQGGRADEQTVMAGTDPTRPHGFRGTAACEFVVVTKTWGHTELETRRELA